MPDSSSQKEMKLEKIFNFEINNAVAMSDFSFFLLSFFFFQNICDCVIIIKGWIQQKLFYFEGWWFSW